jgi:hypothetical protein
MQHYITVLKQSEAELFSAYGAHTGQTHDGVRGYASASRMLFGDIHFLLNTLADQSYMNQFTNGQWTQILNDPRRFQRLQNEAPRSPVMKSIIEKSESTVLSNAVFAMNRDRERGGGASTQEMRLGDIAGLSPEMKFKMLASHGTHGWTSTQQILIDGYHIPEFERLRALPPHEWNSLPARFKDRLPLFFEMQALGAGRDFLKKINPTPEQMNGLLTLLAQNGKIEQFFALAGSAEDREAVVQEFLLGLEKANNPRAKVAALVEALGSMPWGDTVAAALATIERETQRIESAIQAGDTNEKMREAVLWYKLAVASYYRDHARAPRSPWAQSALDTYGEKLPPMNEVGNEDLFPNNTHIRYNLFFNNLPGQADNSIKDRDGHSWSLMPQER